MALQDLGIDPRIAEHLEAHGIKELYPPQEDAWRIIDKGQNTVVAIPTASGKSLIAYLAILHRWLRTGKKSLYIVPLRALASEKVDELRAFRSLGIKIGVATGDLDEQDPKLGSNDVIVCTSEKADSLLRHRTGWVEDVGCVVADEFHLVHDPNRGPTLEVILSRFRALLPDAQIVGLSATVKNAPELAEWLGAELVTSEWRPVDLRMGTYVGNALQFLGQPASILEAGRDPVASLVEQTLASGGQCLVFVSTRRSAEAQAVKLGGVVRDHLDSEALEALEDAVGELGDDEDAVGGPTQQKLSKLIKAGVAYHTAGLDAKQRRFVESNFRAGRIKVLCATPTLAAGVNTPARRVIIRDMTRFEAGQGNRPLPVMEVKQMMGRAGRPRYDPFGEAVLVAKTWELKEIFEEEYLRGEPEPISSKLAADAALRIHTLASVAGDYAASFEDLVQFYAHTFWGQQSQDWMIRDRVEDTVFFLEENGFLERDGGRLKTTLFGKRTSDLYIDPLSALRMKQALESEVDVPSVFGALHVLAGCPNMYPLYLRQSDDWVQGDYYGRYNDLLIHEKDLEDELSYTKTATLLWDWIEELPPNDVETKYQVGPGDVRMRVDTGKWMLHAFRELARALRPEWQAPLSDLVLRLEHGIKEDALPMIRLKGIGRVRARNLIRAGFKRPNDLKGTPVSRIAKVPGFGDKLARELLRQVGDNPGDPPAAQKSKASEAKKGAAAKEPAKPKKQAKAATESKSKAEPKPKAKPKQTSEPEQKTASDDPDAPGQTGLSAWGMKP